MTKLEQIKNRYKISYKEIEDAIKELWNTGTSTSNLHRIFTEKTDCEIMTLCKIIYGINYILQERGIYERITPNDCIDYSQYMAKE